MKTINLFIACLILVSCQVRHNYKIIGNVKDIPDSTVIDLYVQYENMGTRIASDTIMNGKFCFSDSIGDEVLNMYLRMHDNLKYSGKCDLWVGKADIEVSGTNKYLSGWKVSSDIKEQKDENEILTQIKKYKVSRDSLRLLGIMNEQNNLDDQGIIQRKIDTINKIETDKELDYLKSNYNSKISVMHLCRIAKFADSLQKVKIKGFYLKIDTAYINSLWGEGLRNYLNKEVPPKVGDKYTNFKAFDLEGKSHLLSDYSGKYILLDFWGIGCYGCIKSIPELRRFSTKYQNELNIIGINVDTKKKFWVETSKKDSITWINLSDGKGTFGGVSYVYGIDCFPTYILINQEGIIVERSCGFEPGVFEEKLSKYLKK